MRDAIKSQHPGLVIYPQENAIVADPVLVETSEVSGHVSQGEPQGFRVLGEPLDGFEDAGSDAAVEAAEVIIEVGRGLYSIHNSCLRSDRGRTLPARWAALASRMRATNRGSRERR